MKRRNFISSSLFASAALSVNAQATPQSGNEYYELRTYELKFGSPQSNLDTYFKNALIPALNKLGVKNVGVFREISQSEPAKIYLLIPYPSLAAFETIAANLKTDADFIKNSEAYTNLSPDKVPYARYTTSLMRAFDGLPAMRVPAQEPRIFEIRTYESYSEDAHRRKVKMFNDEEFSIFAKTKLNTVFFGDVVAGPLMPCLTYLLTFKNLEERDNNWKAFFANTDWKRISAAAEYANTVSRITKIFLEPLAYSQV